MKTYYAVFADYSFCGLFRSRAAAIRWQEELLTYNVNWCEPPMIEECNESSTFEHRYGTGIACVSGIRSALHALEYGYFGRIK